MTQANRSIVAVQRELEKRLPQAQIRAINSRGDADAFWDLLGVFHTNPPARGTKEMLTQYSRMPWLRAVCDKISSSVATTVWRVFVKTSTTEKGTRRPVRSRQLQIMRYEERKREIARLRAAGDLMEIEEHPLIDAMYATGPTFTGFTNRELTQKWLDLVGEAFWIKVRNDAKMPTAFIPVPPHWVTDTPTGDSKYFEIQTPSGGIDQVAKDDMIWFYHPNPEDPYGRGSGMGVTLADELETDEYAAKFMKTFFYNSARPDVLISSGSLKKEDATRFEKRWVDKLRGWRRAFAPFFMNREVNVHQLGTDYGHLSMLDLRKNQRDAVIQVYGVPPETLGIVEASNRATSEVAEYLYARWVLVPRLEFQRQILQFELVPEYDDRIILDYDSPVAQDKEHILKIATIAPWSRYLDEWREMQGLLPLPDDKGKVFMKPLNYEAVLLDDLGEPYSQQDGNGGDDDQDPENDPAPEPDDEVEEGVKHSWPELLTNIIGRQRITPAIGTRRDQVAVRLTDAFREIAADAREREGYIDVAGVIEWIDEIIRPTTVAITMMGADANLTSAYVLAEELAKGHLEFFVDDSDGIDNLHNSVKMMASAIEMGHDDVVKALREALSAIANAQHVAKVDLLIDGIGISANDAEEFVKHGGEGDAVIPMYEKFAQTMADHLITGMVNYAQATLWSEAAERGLLDPDKVSRMWIARRGCRSCSECSGMDGTTTGIDLAWKLPKGGTVEMPTETHSECHCTERLVRKEA